MEEDIVKKEDDNLISDEDMAKFRTNFDKKLEDEILDTNIGRKIVFLEKYKIGISMQGIIESYIETNGQTMDSKGMLVLDETSLYDIFVGKAQEVSQNLGFDILAMNNEAQLEKMIMDSEYREQVLSSGDSIDGVYIYDVDQNIAENVKNSINQDYSYMDISRIEELKQEFDPYKVYNDKLNKHMEFYGNEDEARQAIQKNALSKLDQKDNILKSIEDASKELSEADKLEDDETAKLVFMREKDEVQFIKKAKNLSMYKDTYGEYDPQFIEELMKIPDTKFRSKILDENGNFSIENFEKFYDDFLSERRIFEIEHDIKELSGSKIDPNNKEQRFKILSILASVHNVKELTAHDKDILEKFTQKIGEKDLFDPEKGINPEKLEELLESEREKFNFNSIDRFRMKLEDEYELTDKKLTEIEYDILIREKEEGEITSESASKHIAKASFEKCESLVMGVKESCIRAALFDKNNNMSITANELIYVLGYAIVDQLNYDAEHKLKNATDKRNYPIGIEDLRKEDFNAAFKNLGYKNEETGKSEKKRKDISEAAILKKIILENRDKLSSTFDKSFTDGGDFSDDFMIAFREFDKNNHVTRPIIQETIDNIRKSTEKVREVEDKYNANDSNALSKDLEEIRNMIKSSNDNNRDVRIKEAFIKAKDVGIELLDTRTLEVLKDADSDAYEQLFGQKLAETREKMDIMKVSNNWGKRLEKNIRRFMLVKGCFDDKEIRNHYYGVMFNKLCKAGHEGLNILLHRQDEAIYKFKGPIKVKKLDESAHSILTLDGDIKKYQSIIKVLKQEAKNNNVNLNEINVDGFKQKIGANEYVFKTHKDLHGKTYTLANYEELQQKLKDTKAQKKLEVFNRNKEYAKNKYTQKVDKKVDKLKKKLEKVNFNDKKREKISYKISELTYKKETREKIFRKLDLDGQSNFRTQLRKFKRQERNKRIKNALEGIKDRITGDDIRKYRARLEEGKESKNDENNVENNVIVEDNSKANKQKNDQIEKQEEKKSEQTELNGDLSHIIVQNDKGQLEQNALNEMKKQKQAKENINVQEQNNEKHGEDR